MHDVQGLVVARLERMLRERLVPSIHTPLLDLDVTAWSVSGPGRAPGQGEPVDPALALSGSDRDGVVYTPLAVGERWGPAWGTTWFHLTGDASPYVGDRLEIVVDLGWHELSPGFQAEGLVYRPDGTVVKGLHPRNRWIPTDARPIDLYVEAAANPVIIGGDRDGDFTGVGEMRLGEVETAGPARRYVFRGATVCRFNLPVWELVHDLEVLGGIAGELSEGDPRRGRILRHIERSLDVLRLDDVVGSARAAREQLGPVLASQAVESAHRVSAVGHAHIDTAWLWPMRETSRKVARTTANVLALMDEEPDFVHAMSSAQQYAWLERDHPQLFERVRRRVADGRFLPVGGMWVESDTNLPGGEALARQFVHGKRYFLERFGVETAEVWLPDSFGYSPALPQIARLAGARWFLTQKISWNSTNAFPHHTFYWEGIDGTRIFTHFPPVDTYNAELTMSELGHASRGFREQGWAGRSLVPFGHGDGGGGPTREMLARARRVRDLEGSPRVSLESPAEFFRAAETEYPEAPVWVGELYLEFHRGTYTSQAAMKQGNRRVEHQLFEAELWSATAALRAGFPYPYELLDDAWRRVLTLQFHDILPGTSISWVHREARQSYAELAAILDGVIRDAQRALLDGGGDGAEIVFNASPFERAGIGPFAAGRPRSAGAPVVTSRSGAGIELDNGFVRATVDDRGIVIALDDLVAGRSAVPPGGELNVLRRYVDLPVEYDAWDIEAYYRNVEEPVLQLESIRLDADEERAVVRVERSLGRASSVVQEIILARGARRLDFVTTVDWRERESLLRVTFDLDVHPSEASYETQFGHQRRPVHENTSWDAARFEVCAHRYVHLAEADYGIAVVNDSSYGHDVRRRARDGGGTSARVGLSLLRAPRFPDPETDQGTHRVRYSVRPGAGIVDALREGLDLNLPLTGSPGTASFAPIVVVDEGSIVVSAVKLADDRSGDLIVRLYEAAGGRARTALRLGFEARSAVEVDLLERPVEGSAVVPGTGPRELDLELHAFQIVTLRVVRADAGLPQT